MKGEDKDGRDEKDEDSSCKIAWGEEFQTEEVARAKDQSWERVSRQL